MLLVIALIMMFVSITGIAYYFIDGKNKVRIIPRLKGGENKSQNLLNRLMPLIKKVSAVVKIISADSYDGIKNKAAEKLAEAGNPGNLNAEDFISIKIIAGLAVPLIVTAIIGKISIVWLLMSFVAGYLYPELWLKDVIRKRQRLFLNDLPYAIDLLTLCVEVGLDFTAGVNKVVSKSKPGYLTAEFSRFLNELKIGKSRKEALEDMGKRVRINEFSYFVSALIQSDEMGTGIGRTLRIQSDELRKKLMLNLEKKAMEAPVKILLPLIGFIFPAIFIIIFGPIILTGMF